jgi:hypothetical protein
MKSIPFDTRAYVQEQARIVLHSPEHRYYTWLALGRPNREPSEEELWAHWCEAGGADQFRALRSREFFARGTAGE